MTTPTIFRPFISDAIWKRGREDDKDPSQRGASYRFAYGKKITHFLIQLIESMI